MKEQENAYWVKIRPSTAQRLCISDYAVALGEEGHIVRLNAVELMSGKNREICLRREDIINI